LRRDKKNDCSATASDCTAIVQLLCNKNEAIVKELRGDYATIGHRFRSDCEATAKRLRNLSEVIIQQLRGDFAAIEQQYRSIEKSSLDFRDPSRSLTNSRGFNHSRVRKPAIEF